MIKFSPLNVLCTFSFLLIGFFVSSQTEEQVKKITATYDQEYLRNLADEHLEKSTREKREAVRYALARNIPITYTTKDSAYAELQRVLPDGTLIYYKTNNVDAAKSTRVNHVNSGGSTGYNLDGQNMIAYVWDGGHPRISHQEYDGSGGNNRVSIEDLLTENGTQLHFHAAHVTGTITASGVNPQAKGMAPSSKVRAYMWNNDLSEATSAASNGMLLSNHSYGYITETLPNWYFGAYDSESRAWDNLMFNSPYYLMIKSAGNDGDQTHYNSQPLSPDYDLLAGSATSKNSLVVAAAHDATVDGNGNLISVNIANFSSPGPTDDLRIKPDITGNGVNLTSTYVNTNSAYGTISGTSMSSPNVTGSLLLLQQHYNNVNGNFMRAASLKGLVLHTADDAGPVGPDVVWGWGLLNTKKAAEIIAQNGSSSLIQERVLNQGQTITLTVHSNEFDPLLASISWTDRPGVAVNNTLNSPNARLVNDLDIRVKKETTTYMPWRLNTVTTNGKGDNKKDPYERVDVGSASGTYTITITHKGTLVGGSQNFSLIVTGLYMNCIAASVPQNVGVNGFTATTAAVSWGPVAGAVYDLRYRKLGRPSWIEVPSLTVNDYQFSGLIPATNYEFQVRSKCPEGDPSAYSEAVNFTTALTFSYCSSGPEVADPDFYISNVKLNTIDNNSTASAYSDFTNISTELVAGQTYNISAHSISSGSFRTTYSVYIDYNRNERFDDPGEQVFTFSTSANTTVLGSFTIPADITPLSTRMRVSMTNDLVPAGPCDSFTFGEVEDYTIHLNRPHIDFVHQNDLWTPTDPAGVCTSVDNIQVINGSPVFTTNITAYNVKVNSGATLNVEKVLTIAGDLTNNGSLVFGSGPSGNGELGPLPTSSTITGNATVQRYMQNKRAYRMISSAVSTDNSIKANWQEESISNTHNPAPGFGTHITGSKIDQQHGFDGTALGNPSMYYVPNGTQSFAAIANTNVNKLVAGFPYLLYIRGDRSIDLGDNNAASSTILRAKGSLYYGTHIQEFSNVNSGDFVMFGNPYQSAVDINSVFANSDNLNTNFYYLYDPADGTLGAYKTVDLSENDGYQYLQPGQAAQVKVSGPATIRFKESDKAPGNFMATNRNTVSGSDKLVGQLYTTENFNNAGPLHDSFVIRFSETFDNEITPMDAVKPMNFYENMGVDHDGTYLSIERREMPQQGEIFQIYSAGYQYQDYTLKIIVDGLEDILFYLQDDFTGVLTPMEVGQNIYTFNAQNNNPLSRATDRFSIRTEARLEISENLSSNFRLYPNPLNGNTFYINAPSLNGKIVDITILDITGRKIYESSLECRENTISIPFGKYVSSGVYLVTLSHGVEECTYRLIKE